MQDQSQTCVAENIGQTDFSSMSTATVHDTFPETLVQNVYLP